MTSNILPIHRKLLDPVLSKETSIVMVKGDKSLGGCGVKDCGKEACAMKSGSYIFCDYWKNHAQMYLTQA